MFCVTFPTRLTSRSAASGTSQFLCIGLDILICSRILTNCCLCSVEIENDDEDLLPEVALGDFLWLDDVQNNIRYEANITDIDVFMRRHLAVLRMSLRLPTDFNLHQGTKFVLQYRHNRTALRRQYHALTMSFPLPRRLLFPSVSDIKPKRHLSRAEIYNLKFRHLVNRRIRDDPQQLQAVMSILEQTKGSVPFIVYGP